MPTPQTPSKTVDVSSKARARPQVPHHDREPRARLRAGRGHARGLPPRPGRGHAHRRRRLHGHEGHAVPRPSRNLVRWSWLCCVLKEDDTRLPMLQNSVETVLARPSDGSTQVLRLSVGEVHRARGLVAGRRAAHAPRVARDAHPRRQDQHPVLAQRARAPGLHRRRRDDVVYRRQPGPRVDWQVGLGRHAPPVDAGQGVSGRAEPPARRGRAEVLSVGPDFAIYFKRTTDAV